MTKSLLGYVQSPSDSRDYIYSAFKTIDNVPSRYIPERIKINEQIIGNCVAQSARSIKVVQERQNHPTSGYDFSEDFVYQECKKLDGIPNEEGTYPRVAMKVLKDIGVPQKGLYEDLTKHNERPKPSQQAYESAKQFKVSAYAKVQTINEIKHAVAGGSPVMGGSIVTSNFYDNTDGWIDLPGGYFLGGHAFAIDGYDDSLTHTYQNGTTRKGFFRIINSWGEDWGDKGYAWLPYDYITFRSDIGMAFFTEAWTSIDVIMPDKNRTEKMSLWIDKKQALVNGQMIELDQPPIISNGRSLVPIRFVSEHLGYKVVWDAKERRIDIIK